MTALNFPASPSSGDVHNAANGLQYAFDGVKWTSQGTYDSGTINAQKLDSIASQFNGSTTTFNLKVNNNTVKPHNEQSVSIVLAGQLQEPVTAYTTSQTGTITFASAPAGGTAFFGVLLTRLPVTSSSSPASGSTAGTMSASDFTKLAGIETGATADQTGVEIKSAYEGNADTNAFTDADHTKLDGIATGAEVNVQSNWNQTDNTADNFIQNKPTIPAAYGNSDVDSHLNTSTASSGQILSWTGSDYDWVADGGGGGSSVGGATGVDFNDNVKIRFGNTAPNSPDLEIYHDGSNSIISDAGTGGLLLYGSDIILHKSGTDERYADFAQDGAARLYYDGGTYSTPKLATTATGVTVDGTVTADKLTTGTTNNNIQLEPNGTGVVEIRGAGGNDGTLQLNCSAQSHGVKIKSPPHSAGASYTLTLPTTDGNNGEFLQTDGSGGLSWGSTTASDINAVFGDTDQLILGNADGDGDDALKLYYGTGSGTNYGVLTADNGIHFQYDGSTKFKIESAGPKWEGDLFADAFTNSGGGKIKMGPSAALQIYHDGSNSIIDDTGTGDLLLIASDIILQKHVTSGTAPRMADFAQDGAVRLYEGGTERFATTNSGISVSGNIVVSGTVDGIDIATDVAANTSKVTNATHTGEVTGSGALTIADNVVDEANLKVSNSPTNGYVLTAQSGNTGGLTWSAAGAAETKSTINALYGDNDHLILGNADGDGDDALKLYYNGSSGIVTADSGVVLQHDGNSKLSTESTGVKWFGDLFCDDGNYIKLGTSADLRLYHDGSNSYISDQGDGSLKMLSSLFEFKDESDNKYVFYANPDFNTYLYYDGAAKLYTSSIGVTVSGRVDTQGLFTGDNNKILVGNSDDLQIFHDGSNSYLKEAGTGNVIHEVTDATIEFKKGGSEHLAKFIPDGSVQLYWDNSLKFETLTSGVKWHGDLYCDDSQYLKLGSSADLQIYHDGSNSVIADNGTGDLLIYGSDVIIQKSGTSEIMSKFTQDGAVRLYFDNNRKFITTTSGIGVTGNVDATGNLYGASLLLSSNAFISDGNKLNLGTGNDLQIHHNGSHSIVHTETGNLSLSGQNIVQLSRANSDGTVGYEFMVQANANAAVQLYYDNALKLETATTGVKWFGDLYCDDNAAIKLGSSADLRIYHDGGNSYISDQGTGSLMMLSDLFEFRNAANTIHTLYIDSDANTYLYYNGSYKLVTESIGVSINGVLRPAATNSHDLGASDRRWATIYAVNALNTSDENEKKDINNCDLGLDFVNKINPVSYKWKDKQLGSKTHYGLLAQNIEDAVKSEGKTLNDFGAIHKPEQESMALNYNQLIAPLVKAIQELSAKVAALEAA